MSQPKILVIEDNDSEVFLLRRSLNDVLGGDHFDLEILSDGEDALQFVHNHWKQRMDFQPCIIVLDLHLPKHDGLEILRAIRQDHALHHLPVLVMTNTASPTEEEELRRMGEDYRLKPKDLQQFRDLATHIVALCKGAQMAA